MKPEINFPDISHSEAEKRTLAKFREIHDRNDPKLTAKMFLYVFIGFIIAIGSICAIIINQEAINELPAGFWLTLVLCFTFSSFLWFLITRKRARG